MKRPAILLACFAWGSSHAQSDTLAQLKALGNYSACTSDQQCRTVPVGAKSCGGPESYLAYSTAKTSPEQAAKLAERYRKEREASNKASGLVSDCRFVMDPGAQCRAGACQLRSEAGAVSE
ncbi:hypothetical protein [Pseudoduganella sp. OTU4001]|uniref:hypothetical protein n=1 Tax=Pseudoduganella sp. OTU4001 TaxID=3043854 RepID=UPI00313D1352